MISINPIPITGKWDIGYALDTHILSSELIGEDPFGRKQFNNTRSEIGELLYGFKYQQKTDNLAIISDTVVSFLEQHPEMSDIESIIPVPPTPENNRVYQPTYEIAKAVAERLKIYFCDDVLIKTSGTQLKGTTAEQKAQMGNFIEKTRKAKRRHNVLLIDDLYQTGTTLNYCTERLKEDQLIDKVYVLAITKTKNQ